MKRLLARLALLAGASALALGTLELAIRMLPLFPINAMGVVMRPDAILDHSLRPGSVGRMVSAEYDAQYTINAYGMRDDELPVPGVPGSAPRGGILLLGDSFMEGYGVNRGEILADRLEQMTGVPVHNAGVKSYSPLLHYLYLRHRGLALRPDTVLLFFDLSDPANDEYYARRLERDPEGLPLSIRPRRAGGISLTGPVAQWFERHSALFCYARHTLQKYLPAGREDVGYAGAALDLEPLWPGRDAFPDTAYARGWDRSFEFLRAIRDLLAERGIAFRVVLYPYGHQVSADAWPEGRLAHNFPPGVSSRRPEEYVLRRAAADSIPVASIWDAFRNHPEPGALYFPRDGHWTPAGHDVAARAVQSILAGAPGEPKSPPE